MKFTIHLPESLKDKLGERGLAPSLEAWLSEGPPPIYIGFGSMPVLDATRMLSMTRRVLDVLGTRAVISAGWSEIAEASDSRIRVVGETDHAALFARCEAAVHHGGAGKLEESRLLAALTHLRRPDVRERAQRLGRALREERGLDEVADALVAA